MQFYLKDWLADTRILNLAERGLWIDALAFMWRSPQRGKLLMQNGCKPDAEAMRNLFGTQDGEAETVIDRLVAKGVASRDRNGVIYCRRMVRENTAEEAISDARRKAAKARWECKDHAKDALPTPVSGLQSPTPTPDSRLQTPEKGEEVPPAPSADGLALAETAYDLITRNHPNLPGLKDRTRRVAAWAKDVNRFLRKSGKTEEEVRAFLTWLAQDRESKAGSRWIGWWQPFQGIGILSKDAAWAAYAGRKQAGRSRYDDVK